MANLDTLFTAWIEGQALTEQELQLLEGHPDYSEMMRQAAIWQKHSDGYQDVPVPEWNRDSTFMGSSASNNSFASYGSWALAASIALCGLVFLLTPAANVDSTLSGQIAKQTALIESQQKQIDQLEKILLAQNEVQQQNMYQLAKQAIATGRVERQEDIANVLSYIKTQRAQDQAYLRMQLNDLAEQVEGQPLPAMANNLEY